MSPLRPGGDAGPRIAAGGASLALLETTPYQDTTDAVAWLIQLAANLFTIGVGLIAWRARPNNRVGLLLALTGFASLVPFLSTSGNGLAWTVGDMWNLAGFVVLAHVYLAFPDGRTTGWSRRLVVAVYATFLVSSIGIRVVLPYPASWPFGNRFLVWPNEWLATTFATAANLAALALAGLVVGTVLNKWWRGSPPTRRALAPVFWVSPITLVVVGAFHISKVVGSDMLFASRPARSHSCRTSSCWSLSSLACFRPGSSRHRSLTACASSTE